MIRTIDGFHRDEQGDWIAELSCLHSQHLRHRPPFQDRAWVLSAAGRAEHLGSAIDCPLCDRAELPVDLHVVRTAGPWDAATLPAALRRDHRVADRTWGRVRVLRGTVGFSMETAPPLRVALRTGQEQPIPPGVPHAVLVDGPFELVVEFLARTVP